eukprot:CAMPEP_0185759558 /NCGR_PEP_ID=MMETSP1174-20130828/18296_1 /TAXON_ID=35687 /ORGANISM="Dictyocha speculum, Strain CCMP1381" /LENGTH=64 /DNA_ID=CAMNT_0028439933 /DNA_START=585 /DNA_END=776 /DNA_ORIENTATION=-
MSSEAMCLCSMLRLQARVFAMEPVNLFLAFAALAFMRASAAAPLLSMTCLELALLVARTEEASA